jgi:hypothetical protein
MPDILMRGDPGVDGYRGKLIDQPGTAPGQPDTYMRLKLKTGRTKHGSRKWNCKS